MAALLKDRARKALTKKSKKGYSGHPLAAIAFYGPTDGIATKVVVSIFPRDGAEPSPVRKWYSERDTRSDPTVLDEILKFVTENSVHSVVMPDRIIGCPHEEGVDYPTDGTCPACPFWSSRDRWTGKPFAQDH